MNHSISEVKRFRGLAGLWELGFLDRRLITGLGLVGIAIGVLYYSTFVWLVHAWWDSKEYSHGFLVPLVCLYLVWVRREHLVSLRAQPSPIAGSVVLLAGVALLLAGRAGGIGLAGAISLTLVLPGIVLFVWGWDHLKVLALPFGYLQFMVPWLDVLPSRIHWPFQLLAADIGTFVLQSLGYPAYRKGDYILLPDTGFQVAEGCSGVDYLLSVIAVGVLVVYLAQRTWWRGIAVIASGVLIGIVANWARVAMAGLFAYHYGPAALHGPSHILQALFVTYMGIIGMLLVNWHVTKLPSPHAKLYERPLRAARDASPAVPDESQGRRLVLAAALLLATSAYISMAAPRFVPLQRPLQEFPSLLGGWSGEGSTWVKGGEFFPGADDQLIRTYSAGPGRMVHVYVGYFGIQQQSKALVTFRVRPLHEDAATVELDLGSGKPKRVNISQVRIGDTRYDILFWYRYPGRDVPGRYTAKFMAIWDGITRWRNNAAVVLLAVPVNNGGGQEGRADLLEFARLVGPSVREIVP